MFLSLVSSGQTLKRSTISSFGSSQTFAGYGVTIQSSVGQSSITAKGASEKYALHCGFLQGLKSIAPSLIEVSIYPNPTTNYFVIDGDVSVFTELKLFDSFGKLVYAVDSKDQIHRRIDISGLSPGMYSLFLGNKYNSVMSISKLIILR